MISLTLFQATFGAWVLSLLLIQASIWALLKPYQHQALVMKYSIYVLALYHLAISFAIEDLIHRGIFALVSILLSAVFFVIHKREQIKDYLASDVGLIVLILTFVFDVAYFILTVSNYIH